MKNSGQREPRQRLPSSENLTGQIRLSTKGQGFLDLEPGGRKAGGQSVLVERENLGTALHLDTVEVKFLPPGRLGPRGAVTKIIARHKTQFVGQVTAGRVGPQVLADDQRVYTPFDLSVKPEVVANLVGQKVLVEIIKWSDPIKPPLVKITKILGLAGQIDTEMTAIVYDRGLAIEFPADAQAEAQKIKAESAATIASEVTRRRDFRKIPTFTIDPTDAKDFDDALSYQTLADGRIEVGVHIADVSYYVQPASALDKLGRERATSIYLVDRTIPMLPEVLSDDLCSLLPDQDRLTYAAVFTFSPAGEIIDEWFGRTIIHSARRFSYDEVFAILAAGQGQFAKELLELNRLAKILRQKKLAGGALVFDDDEVKFILDAEGKPVEAFRKVRNDAHLLIEDFMLLANKRVAENVGRLTKNQPGTFVYRVHDAPDRDRIENLSRFLKILGYQLPVRDGQTNAKALNKLLEEVADKPEGSMIERAVVQSMTKAVYAMTNIGHFGLGFKHYTHFTSPIRRYPDIMVHRLLDLYLARRRPPAEMLSDYQVLTVHTSNQERTAQEAEWDSIKLKQCEFLAERLGEVFDGVVSGIADWGIYVQELSTKAEGLVRLASLGDDYYLVNKDKYEIVGQRTKRRFRLGDKLRIKILSVNPAARQIDYLPV